ncbi:sodium-coupled neutral amino acid transporter 5 isoform X5 [Oryctolagus cuniculus]|uniref:sodium-coupled neutral amino acid transporter 5 isoform X5 n=1 Tax=Oryctolagus cuniculus TaxID=9986 RepID=UPI002230D5F2|nr:sodium-coupled neutral amino acid transporter 5 isoform X5 [Oryctolagus cuniculus]
MDISSAVGMELQDSKMNGGALPADAVGPSQEHEDFLPSDDPVPERKPVQFMDFEGNTSFGMSVFNLSNAIMGSGILGLAYAMSHTGVIFFLDWYLKGNFLIIIVSVIIILPLALMKHLGYLGYTSGLSLTCMLFFLVSVIYKKFQIGCAVGRNETAVTSEDSPDVPRQGFNISCEAHMFTVDSQMSYTVPIMAFAFVCHPEVLPIYTELCRPTQRRMQAVANVSIGAMFFMYALTATFGYLTFYSSVEAELLHMYSQRDLLILCVRLAVLVAVTLTVPVVLFPIRRALQQLLFPSKAFSWLRHVAIALILLVLVNVLVICVPTIRDIFGVIGSTSAPSLIFILPSIFYLRIVPSDTEPLFSWPKIQALCFGILGVLFMAISLGFMFTNWATGHNHMSGH